MRINSRVNTTYCPYCNQKYSEFVYATSGDRFVIVKKNKIGEWTVNPYIQCEDIKKITIKSIETFYGLPYLITIVIEYENGKILNQVLESKNRICPNCLKSEGKKVPALYYGSYVKTMVVTNIGVPGAGKSALAQSLAYGRRKLSSKYAIVPVNTPRYKEHLEATPINATDVYYQFIVRNDEGVIVSNIVLVDTPGELMLDDENISMTQYYAKMRDMILNSDWINIVLDGNNAMDTDMNKNNSTLNEMQRFLQLKSVLKKTSIVMTKADLIRDRLKNMSIANEENYTFLNYNCPLFFDEQLSIAETMKLSKHVIRRLSSEVLELVPEKSNASYFLISAGDEKGDKGLDYFQSVNVDKLIRFIFKKLV